MNRLIRLMLSAAFFISSTLMLTGCPFFFMDWRSSGYEPSEPSIGRLDNTSNSSMEVMEKEISIVPTAAGANVAVPIEAYGDVEGARLRVWIQQYSGYGLYNDTSRTIDLIEGRNIARISLNALPADDTTNLRLGYELSADSEDGDPIHGFVSVQEALSQLNLSVYVPDPIAAGESATVRVMAAFNGKAVEDFDADITMVISGTALHASAGSSSLGIAGASIDIPEDLTGRGEVMISVTAGDDLSRDITVPVTVIKKGSLLLSPDKPRYQPGQTMHLRVMALRRPLMTPLAGEEMLLEIRDGKGFKVFKEALQSNAFGIASTSFKLASEVNMGTYEITASMDEGRKETTEKVIVEHYVLPKFNVSLDLDQSCILPGRPLEGSVDLRYTFGEAVAGGIVSLVLAYGDDTLIATLTGSTDENGGFDFSMEVPVLARTDSVKLTVEGTDAAGQQSSKDFALATADQGIEIWMVPSHDRTAGEPWTIFIIARDPAGMPVPAFGQIRYGADKQDIETDGLGIAEVELPSDFDSPALFVDLQAAGGLEGTADFDVREKDFPLGISLRTDQARYSAGETAGIEIEAPAALGEVQIDVLRRGDVIHSSVATLEDGAAIEPLSISPDMDGVLMVEAFGVDEDGAMLRGRTAMYVFSTQKLTIDAVMDKDVYRPGETAKLDLAVKDRSGSGVPSALGIVIVDEAVYALQSFTPTTYNRFFADQTVSGNIDNIMDREQAEMLLETDGALDDGRERASRALLAANAFEQSISDSDLKDLEKEMEIYWATFIILSDLSVLANYFSRLGYYKDMDAGDIANEADDMEGHTADPWGQPYNIEISDLANQVEVHLTSAGPDEHMGTGDDITVQMTAFL